MKTLKAQYHDLQTRDARRLFALKHITNATSIRVLEFEKISDSTINILFYKHIGEKFELKRSYHAQFTEKKEY